MRRTARFWRVAFPAVVAVVILPDHALSQEAARSDATFKQLTSLVGDWVGVYEGTPIKVQYTLTADGSALMLVEQPGDPDAMITMFTVDGDHVVATHYCSAHNQPRMTTIGPGDLAHGVVFSLMGVTGLKTPDDWHNTGLTVRRDENQLIHQWTYQYNGRIGTRVFRFERKQ